MVISKGSINKNLKVFKLFNKFCFIIIIIFYLVFSDNNAVCADIVLDPGHSKIKFGTRSCSGGLEYLYNIELTDTVAKYLSGKGIDIEITHDKETNINLMDRVKYSIGKKLFISIHHDSAQKQFIEIINGNPCSEKARGFSIFVSKKNAYFEKSLIAAKFIGEAMIRLGYNPSTHHHEPIKGENRLLLDAKRGVYQFDDLIVLKHAKSPAVLFEAGVIIHREDDVLVKTVKFQNDVAWSLEQAINYALNNF